MQTAVNTKRQIRGEIYIQPKASSLAGRVSSNALNNKKKSLGIPAISISAVLPKDNYVTFVKTLFVLFGVAICLYFYMVVSIVLVTVDRRVLEEDIRSETTELSYKEAKYSAEISNITMSLAYREGFVDGGKSSFATRTNVPTLAFRNE